MKKYLILLLAYVLILPSWLAASDSLTVLRASRRVLLTGYTRHTSTQTVSSEISGKVLKVNFDIGEQVGSGPFIELDHTFIRYKIDIARQSLARVEVSVRQAKTRLAYLVKESSRIESLRKEDMATESRRDAIINDLDLARLDLDSALKEKAELETKLEELIERERRHSIYAPAGWTVTSRTVEENENVRPGVPLAAVSDYSELVVPLYVTSDELIAIKSMPDIFDAQLEGAPVSAGIKWVNPAFDEKTRKLAIKIVINKYNGVKRGGLNFSLPVDVKAEGLYIPKAAVSNRFENPAVTLKETGERIQLILLGSTDKYLIAADDVRLSPGIALMSASESRQ